MIVCPCRYSVASGGSFVSGMAMRLCTILKIIDTVVVADVAGGSPLDCLKIACQISPLA